MAYMSRSKQVIDKDVRVVLYEYLRTTELRKHPGSMLIHEMGFPVGKEEGRADVVIVNDYMHCYEIKSDADSLSNLKRQVRLYGKVMNFLSAVVTLKHLKGTTKMVPSFWGIYTYLDGAITPVRAPSRNEGVCTRSLAGMLWKDTSLQMLAEEGYDRGMSRKPKGALHDLLVEVSTPERIQDTVCRQFKMHRRSL